MGYACVQRSAQQKEETKIYITTQTANRRGGGGGFVWRKYKCILLIRQIKMHPHRQNAAARSKHISRTESREGGREKELNQIL